MARLKGGPWSAVGGSQLPDVEGSAVLSEWGSEHLPSPGRRAPSTRRQSQWIRAGAPRGAGAGIGFEDEAVWTPDVRNDESLHDETPSWMTESEEVLHPKWSMLQKRLHLVNGDAKKRRELLWAIENIHNLMTYCKGRDVTDRMKGLVDRFNWVANGTGYKRVARALENPKRIMEAIERILDGECLNRSEELQSILIPLIKEANVHRHQLLALQSDEQEHRIAGVQMRVMMEETNNLEASYRELMQETSSFLKGAIGRCRTDYNTVGKEIAYSAKRRKELASQRERQEVEMYDLERRQRQSHFAIQESEARRQSVHHAHQKQKDILQTELSHIQRDIGSIDKLRDKLRQEIDQAWANLEALVEENMRRNMQRMLELRYARKQKEWAAKSKRLRSLRVEREKEVVAKEHLLEEERRVLVSEKARKEVLDFRLSCLEAKGLWVALLARLRELTEDGLVAQASARSPEAPPPKAEEMELPQGLLQTLAAELELQQRWLVERGQAWEISRSTLTLASRPPLVTPPSLDSAALAAQRPKAEGVLPANALQGIITKQQLVRRSIVAMSPSSKAAKRNLAAWGAVLDAGGHGQRGAAAPLPKSQEGSAEGGGAGAGAAAAAPEEEEEQPGQQAAAEEAGAEDEEVAETASLSGSMVERCGTALDEVLSTAGGAFPFLERPNRADWTLEELRQVERLVGDLKPMEQRINKLVNRWGSWRAVKGKLGLPYMQMLIKEMDSLCGDLRDGWDMANACLHWLTDGAALPGAFTDELFGDLAFLPGLVQRLAKRCGVLAAVMQTLEDGAVNRDRLSFSVSKCYELASGLRDVLADEDIAQAQAWLLRVGAAIGMRSALQVEGKDALTWYVSSVREQGGRTLEAVGRGAQALQVITSGPQMDEIRERAMVAELNDIILAALKAALEVDDPDAYNAAVLVLGSLDAVARGEGWGVLEAWATEAAVRRAPSLLSSQGEEEEAEEEQQEEEDGLERPEPLEGPGGARDASGLESSGSRGAAKRPAKGAPEQQQADAPRRRRGSHRPPAAAAAGGGSEGAVDLEGAGDAVQRTRTDHDAPELLFEGDGDAPQAVDDPGKLHLQAVVDALMEPPPRRKTGGGHPSGSRSRSSSCGSRSSRGSRGSRSSRGSRGSSRGAGRRSSQNSEEQLPDRPSNSSRPGNDATPRVVAEAAERWKITTARRATIRPAGDAKPGGLSGGVSGGETGLKPPQAARGPTLGRPEKVLARPGRGAAISDDEILGSSSASHAADADLHGPGEGRELDVEQPGLAPAVAPAASADVEAREGKQAVKVGYEEDEQDRQSDGTASTRALSPVHDDQLQDFLQSDDLRGGSTLSTVEGHVPGLELEGSELWIELQYELRDRRNVPPKPKSREGAADPGRASLYLPEAHGLSAIGTQLIASQGGAPGGDRLAASPETAPGCSLQTLIEGPGQGPGLLVTSTACRSPGPDGGRGRSPGAGAGPAASPVAPFLGVPDRSFGSSSPTRFHYSALRPGTSSTQDRGSFTEDALKFTLAELQDLQLIGIRSATAKRRSHRGVLRLKPRSTSWPMFPLGMDGRGIRAVPLQEPHRTGLPGHLYGLYPPHTRAASRRSSSRPSFSVTNCINAARRKRATSLGEAVELLLRAGPWASPLDAGQLFIGRTPSRGLRPQGMAGQDGRSHAGQLRKDRWYVVTGKETAPDFVVVGAAPKPGGPVSKAAGERAQVQLPIKEVEEEPTPPAPAAEASASKPARVLKLKGNWLPVAKAEPEPKDTSWWEPWMSLAAQIEPLAASAILAKVEAETRPGTSCSASESSSQTSYCGFGGPNRVSLPTGGLALVGPGARRSPASGRRAPEPSRRAAAAGGSRDGVVASIESFTQVMLPHVANPMPDMYTTTRRPKRAHAPPQSSLLSPPLSPERAVGSVGSPTTAALALRSGYVVGTPEVTAACLGAPVVPEGCGPRAPGTVLKSWPAQPVVLPASRVASSAASRSRASPRVSPSRSGRAALGAIGASSVSPPHRSPQALPRQRRVLIPASP